MCSLKVSMLFRCKILNVCQKISSRPFSLCILERSLESFKPKTSIVRCFHDFDVSSSVQNSYRNLDKVSKDFDIIYRAPMLNYFKIAHYVTFCSATFAPFLSLFYIVFNGTFIFPVYIGNYPVISSYFDLACLYGGLVLMIFQLHVVIQRYPLRLYADSEDNFIAVYRGLLPWNVTKVNFKAGELKKGSSFLGIMPWGDSLYQLKSRKAILMEDHFIRPIYLDKMLNQDANKKD